MAFGFGFNKQKVLSAAEKCVQQGKLQNAIAEYEKVLKNDPKDLTVANTVGDLYARLGDTDKATECFKSVGDAYAGQGFTVKAIAMYKKISKLKSTMENLLKLAELYTQQGLFNDARAQYLQVAEEFLKTNELENASRIFQKILEMDPENTTMRVRLAEIYVRLGKKTEAWQIFVAAAESLRSRGSLSGAEEVLQRMLALDPGNSYALLMQGRTQLSSGDAAAAITSFEKVADLDSNPDGMRDLLKAYIQTGKLSEAGTLANKLLSVHNDLNAIFNLADALIQAGQHEAALQIYDQHSDRLLAENSEKVVTNLHSIIGHVRENPASLETLLELLQKAGETTHINEVIELLAHASVQSGDLDRARDLYQKLAASEPQNALHLKNYQQVVAQASETSDSKPISAEEAAVIVDELEATAPAIHQHYPDAVALAIRSALTDAELFISYNMPGKALAPLMGALPQAPKDLRLNQRLAALHTRAARFAEAAVCCHTLQDLYSDAGYPEEATRYGELAERYEGRSTAAAVPQPQPTEIAADAPEELLIASFPEPKASAAAASTASPWPMAPPSSHHEIEVHSPVVPEDEFQVSQSFDTPAVTDLSVSELPVAAEDTQPGAEAAEADLSSEWEDTLAVDESAAPPQAESHAAAEPDFEVSSESTPEETIEELRFYLGSGMPEQAWAALAKLQLLTQDENLIEQLRGEIETASQAITDEPAVVIEEIQADDIPVADVEMAPPVSEDAFEISATADHDSIPEIDEPGFALASTEAVVQPSSPLQELAIGLDAALGPDFAPEPVHATRPEPATVVTSSAAAPAIADDTGSALGQFVSDLDASLGDDFLKNAPVGQTAAPSIPQSVPIAAASALAAAASAGAATIPAPRTHSPAPPAPPVAQAPTVPAAGISPFGEDAGVDLSEMFGELKQDLESDSAATDEDPETHYSLGIAFREMGLLDEAIGELQKTCQAFDHGRPFPQIMQTYTWLAQCFLDKGVPEAAVHWYEKALAVAGIDQETRTALHYELASAYESAGNKPAALKHFTDVYSSNIDHRDVAERIKALKS
jgi:tetratricopeptide (TPR) repeat protein